MSKMIRIPNPKYKPNDYPKRPADRYKPKEPQFIWVPNPNAEPKREPHEYWYMD